MAAFKDLVKTPRQNDLLLAVSLNALFGMSWNSSTRQMINAVNCKNLKCVADNISEAILIFVLSFIQKTGNTSLISVSCFDPFA